MLIWTRERDRAPRGSGARRATDPVNVIFTVCRKIVVQHKFDLLHVDAPGSDVGRHQNTVFTVLESLQCGKSLREGSI